MDRKNKKSLPQSQLRKNHIFPRFGCFWLPDLALQLLYRERKELSRLAVAILSGDKKSDRVLSANPRAKQQGIRIGMKYAEAQNLFPTLVFEPLNFSVLKNAEKTIVSELQAFSPRVENANWGSEFFFLDTLGLKEIKTQPDLWICRLLDHFDKIGFIGVFSLAFSQASALASTRALRTLSADRWKVHQTPQKERDFIRDVSIRQLNIADDVCDILEKLEVRTLEQFVQIPAAQIQSRFDRNTKKSHAFFSGIIDKGLQAESFAEIFSETLLLDFPISKHSRILFSIKSALQKLQTRVEEIGNLISSIAVELAYEKNSVVRKTLAEEKQKIFFNVTPFRATLEIGKLMNLVHLALQNQRFQFPIEAIHIQTETTQKDFEQLEAFSNRKRWDDAEEAFSKIESFLGYPAVQRISLSQGHLPEARFDWRPWSIDRRTKKEKGNEHELALPFLRRQELEPITNQFASAHLNEFSGLSKKLFVANHQHDRNLALQLFPKAIRLQPVHQNHKTNTPDLKTAKGKRAKLVYAHRVDGGWWESFVCRDYYLTKALYDGSERILLLYFDAKRRTWFLQGFFE